MVMNKKAAIVNYLKNIGTPKKASDQTKGMLLGRTC